MKYLLILVFSVSALTTYAQSKAEENIKEVILEGYIHGAFNELNPDAMRSSFHKDFAILSTKGEELTEYPIKKWAEGVEKQKNDPKFDPSENNWEHKFPQIDITGNAAVVKVELYRKGKKIYTDYLSLYKFENDDWKIVSKIYHQHE